MNGQLLSTPEVATRFAVTRQTLFAWRRERGLPCVMIPGHKRDAVRYKLSELRKWARAHGVSMQ